MSRSNVNERAHCHLGRLESFALIDHQFRYAPLIEAELGPLLDGQNGGLPALLGVGRGHPIESVSRCLNLLPVPDLVQSRRHWARVLRSAGRWRREVRLHNRRRGLSPVDKAVRGAMLLRYRDERLRVVIDLVRRCFSRERRYFLTLARLRQALIELACAHLP